MQGDLEGALKHHAEAVRIDPAFADGWMNYGNALKAVGHLDAATKVTWWLPGSVNYRTVGAAARHHVRSFVVYWGVHPKWYTPGHGCAVEGTRVLMPLSREKGTTLK